MITDQTVTGTTAYIDVTVNLLIERFEMSVYHYIIIKPRTAAVEPNCISLEYPWHQGSHHVPLHLVYR